MSEDEGQENEESIAKSPIPPGKTRYYLDIDERVDHVKFKKEFQTLIAKFQKRARGGRGELLKIPELSSYEIFSYLNQFLWYQDPALTKISHAFYDHILKIKENLYGHNTDREEEVDIVLQVGGTGVGKSETMRKLSKILNVPYVHSTAEQFTSAGYVGRDVEELVREAIIQAGEMGDEELAEYAIVHIDELDKVITEGVGPGQRDVGGEAVQEALLKLLDKGEVTIPFRNPKGNVEHKKLNTQNIFFVLSGAFDGDGKEKGIEQLIEERVYPSKKTIGFDQPVEKKKLTMQERKNLLYQLTNEDLSKYKGRGMIRQLQSRISTIVVYPGYTAGELSDIFEKPKNSLMQQTQWAFERWGIELEYTKGAIKLLGKEAEKLNTGARGVKSVISRFKDRYGFILGNIGAKQLTITEEIVKNPEAMLEKVVEQTLREKFSKKNSEPDEANFYITSDKVYKELSKKTIKTNTTFYKDLRAYLGRKTGEVLESYLSGEIVNLPDIEITSDILKGISHNL